MSEQNYNLHDDYGSNAQNGAVTTSPATNSYNITITNRLSQLNTTRKIRKDAVVMAQAIVTASPDAHFFRGYHDNDYASINQMKQYFEDSYKFLCNKYGRENIISAYVHMDEATPHMHVNFIPITSDGRLSAKDLFARKTKELHKLQNEFYEDVGSRYWLNRGVEGSKSKRKAVAQRRRCDRGQGRGGGPPRPAPIP